MEAPIIHALQHIPFSLKLSCHNTFLPISLSLDIRFSWMKDGMISKSKDWRFENAFSSSLIYDNPTTSALEFPSQCLFESPEALLDFSEDKFDDTLSRPIPKVKG